MTYSTFNNNTQQETVLKETVLLRHGSLELYKEDIMFFIMLANFQAAFIFQRYFRKCQQRGAAGGLHFSYIFQRLTTTSEPWLRWRPLVRNEWWIDRLTDIEVEIVILHNIDLCLNIGCHHWSTPEKAISWISLIFSRQADPFNIFSCSSNSSKVRITSTVMSLFLCNKREKGIEFLFSPK